jgi:CubicO group peptidase (beta-lactamase class C family)
MKNRVLFLCAAACLITACSHTPSPPSADPAWAQAPLPEYWPTNGWRTSVPSAQGVNGAELDTAIEAALKEKLPLHGLLMIRHGYIVKERYFDIYDVSTAHDLYSCTKSFVSALAGIAFQKGYLTDLAAPVLGFFPDREFTQRDARKEAIKLEDLLTMSSGLAWVEGQSVYNEIYRSRDWAKFVLDLPMLADPGMQFRYNSGNSIVLAAIIQQVSGKDTCEFARENLFGPLGIRDPWWERDPSGLRIGAWGLKLPPREMAKLGYLYLHDGAWEGKQVVPASWVCASTAPRFKAGGPWSYGSQWWIDPSIPMYAALGSFGQNIMVVPGRDLVVVFTGAIGPSVNEASELLFRRIVAACTSGA